MRMRGVLAGAAAAALAGCASVGGIANSETITIRDSQGRTVGSGVLMPAADGVQVELSIDGLPAGVHGVHVHEAGRCDPPDFTTAGAHFNPTTRQHGFENVQGHHVGDLPNLTVDANERGRLSGVARGASLEGTGASSLRRSGGTSLVVHASADDYRTDPSGNSGGRIACGVISPAS